MGIYLIKKSGEKDMNWPEYNQLMDGAGPNDNIEFVSSLPADEASWDSRPSAWQMKEGPIYARVNNNPYVEPEPEPEKGPTVMKRIGKFLKAIREWDVA